MQPRMLKVRFFFSLLCCTCAHWAVFEYGTKYMQSFFAFQGDLLELLRCFGARVNKKVFAA